jgi:hypothetical protein
LNTGNSRTGLSSGSRSRLNGIPSSIPAQAGDFRLLEDGFFRLLEDGSFRLLE